MLIPLALAGAAVLYEIMTTSKPDAPTLAQKVDFVSRLRDIARRVESSGAIDTYTGRLVPPGIKADFGVAQLAKESRYGTSDKALLANNLAGFTAEDGTYWATKKFPRKLFPTKEEISGKLVDATRPFRAYASWEESYVDWARLLHTKYPLAFASSVSGDFVGFANGLKGYATDSGYSEGLISFHREVSSIVT